MKKTINTSPLSGFMELKPAEQILFNKIKNTIEDNYKLFGFIPMDNPIIERQEILDAKAGGETEQQIYKFKKGDANLALRFDLTVPLARYVVDKYGELIFPFKGYRIGKVYRGERPQAGRFRELYQADIDIIGDGELSLDFDVEVIAVAIKIFKDLGLKAKIRINNRKIFSGFFKAIEIEKEANDILILIDKWEKIGQEKAEEEIKKLNLGILKEEKIFDFLALKTFDDLEEFWVQNEIFKEGVSELKFVFENLTALGIDEKQYKLDLKIVRGLAYYTGTIYETQLVDYPEIGSVCSGGRYENLASEYINKKLPGVGISIGLTRLFDQLLKKGVLNTGVSTLTKVLILPMTDDFSISFNLANILRDKKIPTEISFMNGKMKKRLNYANKLGIPFVIFIGEEEIKKNVYTIKNMETGQQQEVVLKKLLNVINF